MKKKQKMRRIFAIFVVVLLVLGLVIPSLVALW